MNTSRRRRLTHTGYCLVHLDVEEEFVADFVLRLLRLRALKIKSQRMGLVIRAMPKRLTFWRIRDRQEAELLWK